MNNDLFLRIEGITGESADANHKGWIDIDSILWGASQQGNIHSGGGGGAGKVQFRDIEIQTCIDKATPAVMTFIASGKHIGKVEIAVCKAGGTQIEYCRITLEEVIITNFIFNGVGERMGLSYHFQAAKVRLHYWEQSASGGKGPESASGWNIKENRSY